MITYSFKVRKWNKIEELCGKQMRGGIKIRERNKTSIQIEISTVKFRVKKVEFKS